MVTINKIYTRTGDAGETSLTTGERRPKSDARVTAYGVVDEANSAIGVARLYTEGLLDEMLARIQNDLFDLGADLSTPEGDKPLPFEALRVVPQQVERLEQEIDQLNADIPPLDSFVLPGGSPAAAQLHVARAASRRAERAIVEALTGGEKISEAALRYINRVSDFLFVAARFANDKGATDVKWVPGANR